MRGRELMATTTVPDETAVGRHLNSDLLRTATTLGVKEARYLVNTYYAMQESRKVAGDRIPRDFPDQSAAACRDRVAPESNSTADKQIKRALDAWSDSIPIARWAKSVGIDPVIAAGLAAHIDMARCPTVGHIWRFAGLDPTQERKKGMRCPWNADLKVLCSKIGESFARPGDDGEFYRRLYLQRQTQEEAANQAGRLQDQAQSKLARSKLAGNANARASYSQGKLPPTHVQARQAVGGKAFSVALPRGRIATRWPGTRETIRHQDYKRD